VFDKKRYTHRNALEEFSTVAGGHTLSARRTQRSTISKEQTHNNADMQLRLHPSTGSALPLIWDLFVALPSPNPPDSPGSRREAPFYLLHLKKYNNRSAILRRILLEKMEIRLYQGVLQP
jgi:hypothetical protein